MIHTSAVWKIVSRVGDRRHRRLQAELPGGWLPDAGSQRGAAEAEDESRRGER